MRVGCKSRSLTLFVGSTFSASRATWTQVGGFAWPPRRKMKCSGKCTAMANEARRMTLGDSLKTPRFAVRHRNVEAHQSRNRPGNRESPFCGWVSNRFRFLGNRRTQRGLGTRRLASKCPSAGFRSDLKARGHWETRTSHQQANREGVSTVELTGANFEIMKGLPGSPHPDKRDSDADKPPKLKPTSNGGIPN